MLVDAIKEYGIYENITLKNYIIELEQKYKTTNEIDFFNNLVNFSKNKKIPYHGWFTYREGFSHKLINELISRSSITKDEYILDPFCGSGTTVVEAAINGYSAVGIDINPVSAFISEVKARSYTDTDIELLVQYVNGIDFELPHFEVSREYYTRYREVEKFFNASNFEALLCIKSKIDSMRNEMGDVLYDFFKCGYICIIEKVSDRKRDGNGLKTISTNVTDVYGLYQQQLLMMLNNIKEHRISQNVVSKVEFGNAMCLSEIVNRNKKLMGIQVGAIMYSPPYANSFDYFESYKLEVILSDYAKNMKDINVYRKQAVESFVGGRADISREVNNYIKWMAQEIEDAIPAKEQLTGKRDGRTRKVPRMIQGYFTDMGKVIKESAEVLPTGKRCYIVVDQSAYLGKIIPTDLFLAAIGEQYGFEVEEIIVCRNAKTSGQQVQKYPYLKDSLRESIVVLRRQ